MPHDDPAPEFHVARHLPYTGCRLSEAIALTVDRVDVEAGLLIVETLKKRRSGIYRGVPVPAHVLDALDMVHGVREFQRGGGRGHDIRLWPISRTTAWPWIAWKSAGHVARAVADHGRDAARGIGDDGHARCLRLLDDEGVRVGVVGEDQHRVEAVVEALARLEASSTMRLG